MYRSGYLYVVMWKEWYNSLLNGVPLAMHKPQEEEEDGDKPLPEEDNPSRITQGGTHPAK